MQIYFQFYSFIQFYCVDKLVFFNTLSKANLIRDVKVGSHIIPFQRRCAGYTFNCFIG